VSGEVLVGRGAVWVCDPSSGRAVSPVAIWVGAAAGLFRVDLARVR
jgi:hypothetical protein